MKKVTNLITFVLAISFIAGIGTIITPSVAGASIEFYLDARVFQSSNHLQQPLTGGSWKVTEIDTNLPNEDPAWSAWQVIDLNNNQGWLNAYKVNYGSGDIKVGDWIANDPQRFDSQSSAFAAAADNILFFTLPSDTSVDFWIPDNDNLPDTDNQGGLKLRVEAVPIPGTFLLLFSGLIGLLGIRRKFR